MVKFYNFQPVRYEIDKSKTFASLSSGRKLHFVPGAFKAKVALETIQERETLIELSKKYGIYTNLITRWRKEFLE